MTQTTRSFRHRRLPFARRLLLIALGTGLALPIHALAQAPQAGGRNAAPQGNRPAAPQNQRPAAPQGAAANKNAPAANPNAAAATPPSKIPDIVATVNGESIDKVRLGQECVARYGNQVLENMLNKYLILQACQAQSITISQSDVDAEIARLATKFNLNTQMYLELIEDQRDISPEQYASDIVWPMLALRALSRGMIQVDPQEVNKAFENEFGPAVKVRMIAVQDPKKAAEIHAKVLADPSSFKQMAKQFSEDAPSASVEGLLPPIRRFSGDDMIEKEAFALQPDQVSKVFEVGGMHVMLQCVRHEPATPPNPDQVAAVQLRIRQTLEDEKLQEMAEKMFATLREKSNVVKVFGDPNATAQNPGVAAYINQQPVAMNLLEEECMKRFGVSVLEGEINRKLLEMSLTAAQKTITQADIDQEIARAADYYGFVNQDGTPNVAEWIKNVLNEDGATLELYVRDAVWPTVALKKLVDGTVQVTDEDLKKGFEANYGRRAEVLAIVLSNQRTAHEVWQMARDNPTDAFFGELAAQYSVEPSSRSNYGKVPPIRVNSGQPTLEKVAFGLKPGELSGITEIGNQFVILRSQGFTEPVTKDFNAVKGELYKDLIEKKTRTAMQAHLDKLLGEALIENFLDESKSQVGSKVRQAAAKANIKK